MANIKQGGFVPWGTIFGGAGSLPIALHREVASGYSTALFLYDLVKQVSDGTVAQVAANDVPFGVANGFSYMITGKRYPKNTVPASTTFSPSTVGSASATWVDIIPAFTAVLFTAETNSSLTIATIAGAIGYLGNNSNITVGTGDSVTGRSAMFLDESTFNTSATNRNFRLLSIIDAGSNDPTVANYAYQVFAQTNEHNTAAGL